MAAHTIKHLSLDLWLTLIRSNKAFKPARNELFVKCFEISQPADEVYQLFQRFDQLFNRINEHSGRNISRNEMGYIILAALGKDINHIPITRLDEFWDESEMLFLNNPPEVLDGDIFKTLTEIRSLGITTSLVSNTAFIIGATLRKVLPVLGFGELFDFQVYSDEIEHSKPSPEIFKSVYDQARQIKPLAKAGLLHIGDNPVADYKGAIDAGFKALLFKPGEEPISGLIESTICTQHSHFII